MRFQEKIREYSKEEIWSEYCGFLDISLEEFMYIQRRLLLEQVELLAKCPLGQQIMKGQHPTTVEEFRRMVPLTTYEDYAPMLLGKHKENLPAEPVLWIQTTWEGGLHPLKVAPYTKSMLDTYKHNMMACLCWLPAAAGGILTSPSPTICSTPWRRCPMRRASCPCCSTTKLTSPFCPLCGRRRP